MGMRMYWLLLGLLLGIPPEAAPFPIDWPDVNNFNVENQPAVGGFPLANVKFHVVSEYITQPFTSRLCHSRFVTSCGYIEWLDQYVTPGMDARLQFHQNRTFFERLAQDLNQYRWIFLTNSQQIPILSKADTEDSRSRYSDSLGVLTIPNAVVADKGMYVVECWTPGRNYYYRTPVVELKLQEVTRTPAINVRETTPKSATTADGGDKDEDNNSSSSTSSSNNNNNTYMIIAILCGAVLIAMVSALTIVITKRRSTKRRTDTQPFVQPSSSQSERASEHVDNVEDGCEIGEASEDNYAEIGAVRKSLKVTINKNSMRYKQCDIAKKFYNEDVKILSNSKRHEIDNRNEETKKNAQLENEYSSIQDNKQKTQSNAKSSATSAAQLVDYSADNEYATAIPKSKRGMSNAEAINSNSMGETSHMNIVGPIDGNEYATAIPKSELGNVNKDEAQPLFPDEVDYANTERRKGSQELKYVELDQEWLKRSRESLDRLDDKLSEDNWDTAQPMEYVSIDFGKHAFVAPKRESPSLRKQTPSLKELKRK